MNTIEINTSIKKTKLYTAFESFKKTASSEINELLDILSPLVYKISSKRLEILVGHRINEIAFSPYLNVVSKNFVIKLSYYGNRLLIIFEDTDRHNTLFRLDLNEIQELSISTIELDNLTKSYEISFRYLNDIDYWIFIA